MSLCWSRHRPRASSNWRADYRRLRSAVSCLRRWQAVRQNETRFVSTSGSDVMRFFPFLVAAFAVIATARRSRGCLRSAVADSSEAAWGRRTGSTMHQLVRTALHHLAAGDCLYYAGRYRIVARSLVPNGESQRRGKCCLAFLVLPDRNLGKAKRVAACGAGRRDPCANLRHVSRCDVGGHAGGSAGSLGTVLRSCTWTLL